MKYTIPELQATKRILIDKYGYDTYKTHIDSKVNSLRSIAISLKISIEKAVEERNNLVIEAEKLGIMNEHLSTYNQQLNTIAGLVISGINI